MKTHSKLSAALVFLSLVVILAISVSAAAPSGALAAKPPTATPGGGGATATPTSAPAAGIFYVDCAAGNDANNGTSTSTAWRTLGRASQPSYGPGSQILLKRGCVWTGAAGSPATFAGKGNGTVASPITLADYGTGNLPKVDAYQDSAVELINVQNWVVRNLDLTQHGSTPEELDSGYAPVGGTGAFLAAILFIAGQGPVGVQFCGEPCTARNITVDAVKVHDGQWDGIYMEGGLYDVGLNTYGYVDNVLIQNSEVWNVHKNGIEASGTYTKNITYPSTNIKAIANYSHDNGGDGIVYGPADHSLIDSNNCSYNGRLRNARVGCWTWDSHDVVIQFNEGGHNMTPNQTKGARDGGGFDLDLGAEDSVLQYNWSHDSDGEGFLLMAWPIGYGYQRGTTHNIHMRYNIGERDAQQMAGGIYIFGGPDPVVIFNNTIYYESTVRPVPDAPCMEGAVICHDIWGKSGAATGYVFNNIFVGNGTAHPGTVDTLSRSDGTGTWTYDNNLWYRVEGGVHFVDGTAVCDTFACWQGRGFDANGLNANPLFTGAFGTGPAAYHLSATSPAINRGRVVTQGLRGMGTRDYFGTTTPVGGIYDIGADEF